MDGLLEGRPIEHTEGQVTQPADDSFAQREVRFYVESLVHGEQAVHGFALAHADRGNVLHDQTVEFQFIGCFKYFRSLEK